MPQVWPVSSTKAMEASAPLLAPVVLLVSGSFASAKVGSAKMKPLGCKNPRVRKEKDYDGFYQEWKASLKKCV